MAWSCSKQSGLRKRLHTSAACPRLRPYAGAGSLSSGQTMESCAGVTPATFRPVQLVSIRHTISRTVEHSPSERSYCVRDESAAARRVLERNPACLDTYLCLRSDRPMDHVGEFANGIPHVPKSRPHGMLDLVVRSPRPDLPQGWPAVYWDCADRGRLRGSHVVDTALFHSNQYCAASACEHCDVSSLMNPGALPAIALSCTPMKLPCRLRVVTAGSVDCACSRGRLELEGVGQNLQGHALNLGHAFELTTIPTRTLTSFSPHSASHRRHLHKWDR